MYVKKSELDDDDDGDACDIYVRTIFIVRFDWLKKFFILWRTNWLLC